MRAFLARRRFAAAAALVPCLTAAAAASAAADTPPHLDEAGAAGYREFLAARGHKAFVIAPGGAWAWKAEAPSDASALQAALLDCAQATAQRCVRYAVGDTHVFDAARWPTLWAPYPTQADARRAPVGIARGQRFVDLAFRGTDGHLTRLSALHGSVVVLHFWGSWCGPCRRELPQLQELTQKLGKGAAVKLVLLQVREPIANSRAWLQQQRMVLPLSDSGARASSDDELTLADQRRIKDRELAATFPTSYVLDRQGIVLFAHAGAIYDWSEYLPFLQHAAAGSSRP